ncbi:valine--tRNA ligase [Novosphingobium sp.]|uniref:valine--tRNA ligase n=1 Tax=Novosphingobium sp. TaxID=1874826 RepID=UPI0022C3C431|nr:valine--tRNA ligase [Novosphingobium sp.]MCZ8018023.1 valine--tRNA ligase [Novosphingobium sp.]MCZ8034342.1 valine--tRNA ligase [Novosphingobium sp.]MCZ8052310.1 valine--tRNA ligase [Novosphingobium sp.]MCZ8061175.1 valine--tRNA ligase [Novosphingobium sp.]MCZ8232806.1 valine--tRNA ligase [Novosphingobium sp.]
MTDQTLDKTFDPAAIEAKWYAHWEANGLFRPERPEAQPYTIVNPPPNVTGSLHIGHALDNTLQDVVIRYERLRGKDALWVVGTDHAGIATQMVVERQLEARQDKRTNYSREDFVAKVWEWKAESGGTITRQLRRLGCSMDWSREQFTMDPHFTRAVVKVFVDLYNRGLIYRDKRLVNWDPKLKTAISDLEVETREVKGHFWRFRYPFADGSGHMEVATTRPETMLADMAVAVNPEDERYQAVIGKEILQPITGRRFKVVADEHADPALGSGVVKITPGHDFNDFEVGKRAGIKPADMLNMFDAEARVVQTADGLVPEEFLGLDRFVARELVVARMKEAGCLIPHVTKDKDGNESEADAEPRVIQQPYGDRGGVPIEPWLTDQWYVNAAELAKAPLEAVRSGAVEIVPKTWEKTFFNWMENIQPWCVSRQLWWGHRIPAWHVRHYKSDGTAGTLEPVSEIIVDETLEGAYEQIVYRAEYADGGGPLLFVYDSMEEAEAAWLKDVLNSPGPDGTKHSGVVLVQDTDVLDTWFSSALWPFATLGWPEADAPLLAKHYPNDLLISGFDILFFWDARMMMMGQAMTGQDPWKRLYLHGLVRAPDGQKMSKSKGNVVDPLGLIDQYGADALRFFMAAMESQGRDIKMDEKRVEGYRNFATKLWNAARFCQSNGIGASKSLAAPAATSAVNKWIIGEVVETLAELDKAMADLRFDAAANAIYHFVWDQFCDWYIELIKGSFDDETRAVAGWVLDQILVMLHPFMPFVTEELWSKLGDRADYPLITAQWPQPGASVDPAAKAEVDWLIALIGNLRTAKNELGIAPGAKLDAYLPEPSAQTRAIIERNPAAIERLARLNGIRFEPAPAGAAMQVGAGDANVIIPLESVIDIAAEKARLAKALEVSTKEAKSLEGRLSNPAFVEKAKPEAVEKARADHAMHQAEAERLAAALARLG